MSAMKTSWQTETGHLECRWSEAGERLRYNAPWLQDASRSLQRKACPVLPDFRRRSPFGWYVLECLRSAFSY